MSIRAIRGTPWDAALMQTFVGPALPRMPGPPFGMETLTKRYFTFDPWWAHFFEIVNSAVYLITGNKGAGKSTLEKVLALRLAGREGRYIDIGGGEFRPIKILFNDRKFEDKDPEFFKLVDHLLGEVVTLNKHAFINIFDPRMNMDEDDMVETAVNVCEMISKTSPLSEYEELALQIGVWKMYRDHREQCSPEMLEAVLLSLVPADLKRYYQEKNPLVNSDAAGRLPWKHFAFARTVAAINIGKLLRGTYGGIFGGQNSLRDILSNDVVLLDWTGVSEDARTLLSAMLWKWRSIAQRRGDHALIPDLFFSDEEHQAMRNLMYARFMSSSLKEVRATPTAYFLSTQHETDLVMAGEAGSELRRLSESVGRSIGGRFIAQQPDDDEVLNIYRKMAGFSELNVRILPTLRKGHFFFHAPGYAPVPFKLYLTQTEKWISDTTSAVRSMTRNTTALEMYSKPRRVHRIAA